MTPGQIRQAIQEDESLYSLLPDVTSIAAELSSRAKEQDNSVRIGIGTILATLGVEDGNALLDAIKGSEDYKYAWVLVERGDLDVNSPIVDQALDGLVLSSVITPEQKQMLLDSGLKPVHISPTDVSRAVWSDDGQLLIEVD